MEKKYPITKQQHHKEASVSFGLQLGNTVHHGVDGMGMTLGRQGGRSMRQLLTLYPQPGRSDS